MKLKIIFTCLCIILCIASSTVYAWLFRSLRYEGLIKKSDLIVVAKPTKNRITQEKLSKIDNIELKKPAIGIETTFLREGILKGTIKKKEFVLHHYQVDEMYRKLGFPFLLRLNPKDKTRYLLFLKKEEDGRYAPLSGFANPGLSVCAIKDNYVYVSGKKYHITNQSTRPKITEVISGR
jgi:hypothetical protein